MLLVIEIVLTAAAWRRGWKGRALLPFVFGLGFMFVVGIIAGVSGVREMSVFKPLGLACDVAVVVALAYMARHERRGIVAAPPVALVSPATPREDVSSRAA
jgi:hypothetical protein